MLLVSETFVVVSLGFSVLQHSLPVDVYDRSWFNFPNKDEGTKYENTQYISEKNGFMICLLLHYN